MLKNDVAIALDQNILKVLVYFDIFNWPLTAQEILAFGNVEDDERGITESLEEMAKQNILFSRDGYYSLRPGRAQVDRRLKGNDFARRVTTKFIRQARLISWFPFVEAVMASGSYSKGYMDETSDLDFFIVCKKNRLWISRLLLACFKRIFYLNSHKNLCANYFIDTARLTIEERNIYTATELATLVPLYNAGLHTTLLSHNKWVLEFLPNFTFRAAGEVLPPRRPALKAFLENVFEPIGDHLNIVICKMAVRRWKRLYADRYPAQQFKIAFKSDAHISKNHPNNFQERILSLYASRLKEFGVLNNIPWL